MNLQAGQRTRVGMSECGCTRKRASQQSHTRCDREPLSPNCLRVCIYVCALHLFCSAGIPWRTVVQVVHFSNANATQNRQHERTDNDERRQTTCAENSRAPTTGLFQPRCLRSSHARKYIYIYIYNYIYICICIHIYVYVYSVERVTNLITYVCVCANILTHIHIYIYIHNIYIYTYTPIYIMYIYIYGFMDSYR